MSRLTAGFSGAEIENLVNHAVIDCVDNNKDIMDKNSFEEARDRVLTGIKLKISKLTHKKLLQTAVHESGHILICLLDKICKEDIHKVSIIPRGKFNSKSYSLSNDSIQGTKEEMISWLDVSLGGIFAEGIYFNDINKIGEGCNNGDLEKASIISKNMIKKYGMILNDFGMQVINDDSYIVDHKISEYTRDKLDSVTTRIINERSKIVKNKLIDNSEKLKIIIKSLLEYEELTKNELNIILGGKQLESKIKNNSEIIKIFEMNNKII